MNTRREDTEQVTFDALLPKGYREAIDMLRKAKGWNKTVFLQRAVERMCAEELAELGIHVDMRDR